MAAGLYLRIDADGSRRWSFIYHRGRRREMSLGVLRNVPLGEARRRAQAARLVSCVRGRSHRPTPRRGAFREVLARVRAMRAETRATGGPAMKGKRFDPRDWLDTLEALGGSAQHRRPRAVHPLAGDGDRRHQRFRPP